MSERPEDMPLSRALACVIGASVDSTARPGLFAATVREQASPTGLTYAPVLCLPRPRTPDGDAPPPAA